MTDTNTFRIPAANWVYLSDRIEKLQRRQARLVKRGNLKSTTPISVERVGTEIITGPCAFCDGDAASHKPLTCADGYHPVSESIYYICRVTGDAPAIDGFEFVATLQHEDAGTILRTVPTVDLADGELSRFRSVKPHCEHCQIRRFRKDSFVVRNVETRELIQVGRNCLGKYIGGASPESVAKLAELQLLACDIGDECGDYFGPAVCDVISLPRFLTLIATETRLNGWLSRGRARDTGSLATVDVVWRRAFPSDSDKDKANAREFRKAVTDADRDLARDAFAAAGAFFFGTDCTSDYEHNLRVSLSTAEISMKLAGIAGSLISWHERRTGRAAERKVADEKNVNSAHFGAIKERLDFVATVERIFDAESDYGVSHGHFFRTADGNVAVWWTGSVRLEVGTTYDIRGTVKKHDEYKGTKQTVVTRCTVSVTS